MGDFAAIRPGTNLPVYARELVRMHDAVIGGGRSALQPRPLVARSWSRVLRAGLDSVVIEVGGVALLVNTTPRTAAGMRTGQPGTLSTTLVVREESLTLFGFADPDGNTYSFLACKAALNYPKYCSPEADAALQAERGTVDPAKRKAAWKALADQVLKDRPGIYILHRKLLWAYSQKLTGFVPYPAGLVRFTGLKLN